MKVETIANGCPICKSDVKGNPVNKYYCKVCNILFSEKELGNSNKAITKYILVKPADPKPILSIPEENKQFIASKESNRVHATNCFFAKKIKIENLVYFRDWKDAVKHGYRRCVCLKY